MPHPSEELKQQQDQLEMFEAALLFCESLGDEDKPELQAYGKLRAAYLVNHALPPLREAITSSRQYLEWEQRTNNPPPRPRE